MRASHAMPLSPVFRLIFIFVIIVISVGSDRLVSASSQVNLGEFIILQILRIIKSEQLHQFLMQVIPSEFDLLNTSEPIRK